MRQLVTWALFSLCASVAYAGPCLPGTLQTYIGLGSTGCEIGAVSAVDFTLDPIAGFATPIDPASVQITPDGTLFNPTFLLTLNLAAGPGDVFSVAFDFSVIGALAGSSIALNSASATGDGAVTGILQLCPQPLVGFACLQPTANAIAFAVPGDFQLSDTASFGRIDSFFDVFFELTIDGGTFGTGNLGSSTIGIAAVPEPSALFLIAAGLAAIAVRKARVVR
jgi:hypothetical protein